MTEVTNAGLLFTLLKQKRRLRIIHATELPGKRFLVNTRDLSNEELKRLARLFWAKKIETGEVKLYYEDFPILPTLVEDEIK